MYVSNPPSTARHARRRSTDCHTYLTYLTVMIMFTADKAVMNSRYVGFGACPLEKARQIHVYHTTHSTSHHLSHGTVTHDSDTTAKRSGFQAVLHFPCYGKLIQKMTVCVETNVLH